MAPQTNHPSDADLSAFVTGQLSGDAWHRIQLHVSGCERCAQRIARISPADDGLVAENPRVDGNPLSGSPTDRPAVEARSDSEFRKTLQRLIKDGDTEEVESLLHEAASRLGSERQWAAAPEATEHFSLASEIDLRDAIGAGIPSTLGDFELVREIGRGGMGVVYEARQTTLKKRVALKILPGIAVLDRRSLLRFKNEARAAAQLEHPNIVPVHAVGCDRSVHYYAMQFIDGVNLASLIHDLQQASSGGVSDAPPIADSSSADDSRPSGSDCTSGSGVSRDFLDVFLTRRVTSSRQFLKLFLRSAIQVAEALHYAHAMGVVHRDIKPANLLLDDHGNTWLTDFGLAQVQGTPGVTVTGNIVGTLRYMSPEQAYAKRVVVDHRTDIYSLGVTLYEFLTLKQAIDGGGKAELLRQVAFEDPTPPRRIDPRIPVDLETIILKAVSKNPDERYQTAQDLADELRRVQRDEPIQARRPTLPQRVGKWSRKHRSVVVSAAVVILALFVMTAVSAVFLWDAYSDAQHERDLAEAARKESDLKRREAEQERTRAIGARLIAQSSLELSEDPALALALAVRGAEMNENAAANNALLAALDTIHEYRTFEGHEAPVGHVGFSPDGKYVVSTSDTRYFGVPSLNQPARVWDVESREVVGEVTAPELITSAAFSPRNGRRLLTASSPSILLSGDDIEGGTKSGLPRIWDWRSNRSDELTDAFLFRATPESFHPSGDLVVTPAIGHAAAVWDVVGARRRQILKGHSGRVLFAGFSPVGDRIVTFSEDNTVRLWKLWSDEQVEIDWWAREEPNNERCVIETVCFSPDGNRLVTAARGKHGVQVWDCNTGQRIHEKYVRGYWARYTPQRGKLVTFRAPSIDVYDATSMERLLPSLRSERYRLREITLSPDGRLVAARSRDNQILIWSLESGELVSVMDDHRDSLTSVAFAPDSRKIISGSEDQTARVWTVDPGSELHFFSKKAAGDLEPIVKFSQSGDRLLVATAMEVVTQRWDLDDLSRPAVFKGRSNLPQHFGQRLLTDHGGWVSAFDAKSEQPIAAFAVPTAANARLSPNGRLAVVVSKRMAWLWNLQTGGRKLLDEVPSPIAATFDKSGARFALRGNSAVGVYDADTLTVRTFDVEGTISAVNFADSGERLLAVVNASRVSVWNLGAEGKMVELSEPGSSFSMARFSSDGKRVLTYQSPRCQKITCWKVDSGEVVSSRSFEPAISAKVAVHPLESKIAIAGETGVLMWDFENREEHVVSTDAAAACAFSRNGRELVTASSIHGGRWIPAGDADAYSRPSLRFWDAATGRPIREVRTPVSSALEMDFSNDGSALFVQAKRYGVGLFDADTTEEILSFPVHGGPLVFAAFTSDGRRIVTASRDHTAAVWDAETGRREHSLDGHTAAISAASLSSDGTRFATADASGEVNVWDIANGERVHTVKGHRDAVVFVDFGSDRQLLTGSLDPRIQITDLAQNRMVDITRAGEWPRWGEFSQDGTRLLTNPCGEVRFQRDQFSISTRTSRLDRYPLRVLDPSGKELGLVNEEVEFDHASFLGDGRRVLLVTGGEAKIFDIASGEVVSLGSGRPVRFASSIGDGTRVLVLSEGQGGLWDAETLDELLNLPTVLGFQPSRQVEPLSPDGAWLITVEAQTGRVRRWPVELQRAGEARMPRRMSSAEAARFQP